MKTCTIGFTRKSAETFFAALRGNDVARVIDVRLNNVSQLAGFAKRDDLRYFLETICGAQYLHVPDLAPTPEMLKAYQGKAMPWEQFEDRFLDLMAQRHVERVIDKSLLDHGCLLCSEHEPHHCHRRLVADYLNESWGSILEVNHLY